MSAPEFGRTLSGKINKAYFVGKVICYVEGEDDVSFFAPLKRQLDIRFESANGKAEALKLARSVIESQAPFLVLLDDDFDVVAGRSLQSQHVLYVGRYSIENLIAVDDLLTEFVQDYCGSNDDVPSDFLLLRLWEDCGDRLSQIVLVDLAADLNGGDRGGVPDRIEMWIESVGRRLRIKEAAWETFQQYVATIGEDELALATQALQGQTTSDMCTRHLRGHLVFGLLRDRAIAAVKAVKGGKCVADNRMLLKTFSELFWRSADRSGELRARVAQAKLVASDLL